MTSRSRLSLCLGLLLAGNVSCGSSEPSDPTGSGSGGQGSGGTSGSTGSGGAGGTGGSSGSAGSAGSAGAGAGGAGTGGSGGASGSGGGGTVDANPANKRIAVGPRHACAVTDSRGIACWGAAIHNNDAPEDTGYDSITTGDEGSCARRIDGTAICWGALPEPPLDSFSDLSALGAFACGITATDGKLLCWTDSTPFDYYGAPVDTETGFKKVAASSLFVCVLNASDAVECWHSAGSYLTTGIPAGAFIDLSGGSSDACAITSEGFGQCWGGNLFQQNTAASGGTYRQVVAGKNANCWIKPDGSAECTAGTGQSLIVDNPPPAGIAFIEIAAGEDIACGIATNGDVHCWGDPAIGGPAMPTGLKALVE